MIWIYFTVGVAGHEIAHYLVARSLGLNARFFAKWYGVGVKYWVGDGETRYPTKTEVCLVCAAGPLFNLTVAFLYPRAAFVNITILIVALLPIKGSDGWKIIKSLH